jgi:hypothetical protein
MVIYTSNIIYGFSTKSHTHRRGGYTQGSKYTWFSNITPNLRRARVPPTPTGHIQHITSNLRRARPPPTSTPQNQHITPNPFNPLQPKYPMNEWLHEHTMRCYMLHIYIYTILTKKPYFPFSSFPLFPPPSVFFGGWIVSCIIVWPCTLLREREILVVRFTGTVASHF